MKLLLTSRGIPNKTLQNEFLKLVALPKEKIKTVFIITTALTEAGDKHGLVDRLVEFSSLAGEFDVLDIKTASKKDILDRLSWANVIVMSGGNTYHQLNLVRKTGLDKQLPELLIDRVYVGISAGSILMTPDIDVAHIDGGDENDIDMRDTTGLSLVDFELSPHTPEDVSLEANKEFAKKIMNKLIAYDDNMAVKVDGDLVEVVGEGKYWEFNK